MAGLVKLYGNLTYVRMRPAAIALNYSVKDIRHDVRQIITRQMMIIAGGEPELCRRRHAKREGGVYVLSRMQCARVVLM